MNTAMSVSAVIPTRNRSNALAQAIRSVREQGECVREIVVVDDASEPPHAERVVAMAGQGVSVIRTAKRVRGSAARNLGWRAATGPIVLCVVRHDGERIAV